MCHGNAEDIGHASIDYLASQLSANICLFDYAGYGLHTCKVPSEANCQKDVVAVYEYLIQTKKIHPEKIVIYGRSLGSGPACYLAYHLRDQYLRPQKLILVSPLRSGASIFTHSCIATPVDIFMNYRLAPYIQSSVLILHGDRDEVVPYECGEDLATRFPNLHRFHTLNGYSHNDIQSSSYYDEIKQFLRSPIKL
jgi:pimeloyl-ACP methyl ester carboxylesterase